ncbi:hypothetical protein YYC_02596 [Plasmodium yoelii 17X]|uniref:Uncharacterized protein n=2 Tax=Plasmodium yoelii TaxID=5861 RepID=A0A077Y4C8_PLAYE|nr:conserved protein, unknown function [Plasmodium yoelii]ETB60282.1 hypothetical protein YYC_02596 [Plasmodium yoelii 17X]CDU17574.1 conserved Plasmodium membrane protein, unknown function [Plasmodium yoelii]VTZ77426.1 conserved protein, unknown function [Plasmodium yoelii]|eukprot:XP_022811961.1 conserved protein, unknown function [Plasmodium yoelii]
MFYLEKLNSFIENKYAMSNWNKKKYIWRYSLFFNIFYVLLIFGIIYTLIIKVLISQEKFVNHSCSVANIASIQNTYVIVLVFISLMGFLNFIFSRLTYIYSKFTNSEFFNLGIYYSIIGFLIKYISWILSLIYISWIGFLLITILSIIFYPNKWCSPKYNNYGMDALTNCLLVKNDVAGCEIPNDVINIKSKEYCSDLNYLKVHKFLYLVRSSSDTSCTLKDKKLCNTFLDFLKNKPITLDPFSNCSKYSGDAPDDYFLENTYNKSDIYLLSLSLIFFFFFTTIILFAIFILIRVNTPIDSSFKINSERLNIFFRFTRIFDVWK